MTLQFSKLTTESQREVSLLRQLTGRPARSPKAIL
jgi:hypothetical protein